MDYAQESLLLHKLWKGKLEVKSKVPVTNQEELSLAYTPGVATPCLEIQKNTDESFELTGRWNTIAVVTDGTAVLGLGDIGPEAAMPVMEGKCVLFKTFGDVDAVPICIRSKDVDEIVKTVRLISGSFGGINLEDISAPRCFEIERQLKLKSDIPIFHDDQHGTAVVVLAAMINALKIVAKKLANIKVVVCGAGAAGMAVTRLLQREGLKNIILCDRQGAIYIGRDNLNAEKRMLSITTNPEQLRGSLADVIVDADVFIGLSSANSVTQDMVRSMAPNPILFPMANPVPEIMPDLAREAGAAVIGTGRSDFDNQINNVLAFPGIFRGALDVRASDINDEMKVAAAYAIAGLVSDEELRPEYIIPKAFDSRLKDAVSAAVAQAARESRVARMAEVY